MIICTQKLIAETYSTDIKYDPAYKNIQTELDKYFENLADIAKQKIKLPENFFREKLKPIYKELELLLSKIMSSEIFSAYTRQKGSEINTNKIETSITSVKSNFDIGQVL